MHLNKLGLLILFSLCLFVSCTSVSVDEDTAMEQGCDLTKSQGRNIKYKEYTVFDGNKGWLKNGITYKLACGPSIVECANGDLLCTWLSGSDNEPSTDNCVLISRSTDGGKSWSEPEIFIPAGEMASSVANMHKAKDGRIVVFAAHWPTEFEYTVWYFFKIESFDNGHTWSEPEKFEIHNTHAGILAGPIALPNNKYLYPGQFFDKRQMALKGHAVELAKTKDESTAKLIEESEHHAGKFGAYLHGSCVFIADDEISTDFTEYGYIANRPLGLIEPTVVQLKNGKIVMLMRAQYGGFLWRSESDDNGKTWSKAWQTDIPNPSSKVCLVKLPDNRVALLHNPNGGRVGYLESRTPLSLWISNADMTSWEIKKNLFEGGQLAYPEGIIYNNDLVFAYDKNRRQIKFVKIKL